MDLFELIAAERRRLADSLDELSPDAWGQPSMCGSWANHVVAAHLNVPFEVSIPSFALAMARALGNFDRANDRLARDLAARWDPARCVEGLRANAAHRFTPPGLGPEAPLSDVLIHGGDVLHPLGRAMAVAEPAWQVSLAFAVTPKAGRAFRAIDLDGVRLEASDADVSVGDGPAAVGPALALLGATSGRTAYLDELGGEGAEVLRQRFASRR